MLSVHCGTMLSHANNFKISTKHISLNYFIYIFFYHMFMLISLMNLGILDRTRVFCVPV